MGIRVPTVSLGVFALGAFLAALGGVIGGGFLGVYPGADFEILPYAFVVVIVGGLGSLPGAMVGSLLVGLLDNFGKALFPELAYFTLFAPMALILALRPDRAVRPRVIDAGASWQRPRGGRARRGSSRRRSCPAYPLTLLTQAAIIAILAMSLDVLLGYTGLPSLGHAAYFGVAAYAVGILATEYQRGFLTCLVAGRAAGRALRGGLRPARDPCHAAPTS